MQEASAKPSVFKLLLMQFKLLLKKNFNVKKRNRQQTLMQFLVPFFVNFVLFIITVDDMYNPNGFNARTWDTRQPDVTTVGGLPTCNSDRMPSCVTPLSIVHKPADDESANFVSRVVASMLAANDHIGPASVRYFNSSLDYNLVLYEKPNALLAAVHFPDDFKLTSASAGVSEVTLQYNQTRSCVFGVNDCSVPWRDVALPLQLAVETALIGELAAHGRGVNKLPGEGLKLGLKTQPFPNPEIIEEQRKLDEEMGRIFVLLGVLFTFYIQCNNLVMEKERKLKLQMRMMGTHDTPMWLSWWLVFLLECLFCTLAWLLSGAIFQFNLYLNTDFGVLFCFFFTIHLALAGYAAFLSTILRTGSQVIGVCLFFFMFNYLFDGVIAFVLYSSLLPRWARNLLSVCFPPFLYALGFTDLYDALGAKGKGMQWEEIDDNGVTCDTYCARVCQCDYTLEEEDPVNGKPYVIYPLSETMEWCVFDWLFFAFIAVYFENVVPNAYGRSQPLWYLFLPSYWGFGGASKVQDTTTDVSDDGHDYDDDVLREQNRVLGFVAAPGSTVKVTTTCPPGKAAGDAVQIMHEGASFDFTVPEGVTEGQSFQVELPAGAAGGDGDDDAVRVINLCKRFGGKCGNAAFTAVFKINFGVKNDQLFCLLGHNGAGKTTTFNMLSGMFPPTRGDAQIFGKSVRHELRQVQGMMGICPQHDVLWSELSAHEHLSLFAGLSLVEPSKVPGLIEYFLNAVDLADWGNTPCSKYSGGMRRRLSVACSLIADPNVVYLDEPTTGMDPVNRRGVWDVIEKAKKDRVVVLTTHAMEEADTLGDVISIMSRGRLHCLGTSLHLKNKYGSGYHVDVTCTEATHADVGQLLGAKLTTGHRPVGATQYSADVPLTNVAELRALCAAVEEGGEGKRLEMDLSVSMCTLENVFIRIAKQAKDPEAIKEAQARAAARAAGVNAAGGTVMVTVPCPAGKAAGDAVQIIHEGASFDLTVPDGVTEGQNFQVALPASAGAAAPASQVNEISTHGGSEGTRLGADPLPDTEGLLTDHLQFSGTPFGTQFKALFLKNVTSQKRQPGVNCCVLLLTALMMSILILLKVLPGIIGVPQIFMCGTNVTSDDTKIARLTIPNVQILEDVKESFEAISQLESCTDAGSKNATEWEKMRGWVGSAMCSTSSDEANIGEKNRARMYAAFKTYGCDNKTFEELEASYAYLRTTKDEEVYCNVSLRPDVTFVAQGLPSKRENVDCDVAKYIFFTYGCSMAPRICPSDESEEGEVSELQRMNNTYESYQCSDNANEKMKPYLVTPPDVTGEGVTECLQEYMCIPEHQCAMVPEKLQTLSSNFSGDYENFTSCSDAAATTGRRLAALAERSRWTEPELRTLVRQYAQQQQQQRGGGGAGAEVSAAALLSHLAPPARAAMPSSRPSFGSGALGRLLGSTRSRAASAARKRDARLEQLRSAAFSKAVREELAASRAAAAGAQAASHRELQEEEFLDDEEQDCLVMAAAYCTSTTIISECPSTLDLMRAKTIPFSSDAGTADLGKLTYEPSSVSRDCLEDESCYQKLQELEPSAQAGVLGNFSLWSQMSQTNQRLSAPNVSCAFAESGEMGSGYESDGVCAGSLAELNQLLYSTWYHANRSDIDYEPENQWVGPDLNLEGAYEVASHYSAFSLADLDFEHTVLYNGTYYAGYPQVKSPGQDFDPSESSIGALANRVHAAIATAIGAAGFEHVELRHMGFPSKSRTFTISYEFAVDVWVVPFVLSFFLPLQVMLLVSEKSQYMRECMTMSGLRRSAFWVINWLYGYFLFLCQLVVVLIIGFGNGHRVFVKHDAGLIIIFYLLFGCAMTSLSCFFSTFFNSKAIAGIVASCFVFLVGLYGYLLGETLVGGSQLDSDKTRAVSLIPLWACLIGQRIIGDASPDVVGMGGHPLSFDNIGADSTTPVGTLLGFLVLDMLLYALLGVYLDMTLPVGPGVKHPWLFFTQRAFWAKAPPTDVHSIALPAAEGEAAEVSAERARALEQVGGVRAIGLVKQYPGASKKAVQNVQFAVKPDECFGLLGSNGAGKSTTIHMLCGVHAPSQGTVLCGDASELDAKHDITTIQSAMGVCTQDNLLWGELTGAEHLSFFARMRRVAPALRTKHIDYWLKRVNLHSRADRRKRARAYSGGMKRRLSVANAFIGNPRLVYLDEPSTGLDPESRRQLWHAVLAAKPSKCIILTTHALEEAEALCDRVGIMTLGLMRTLGTPTQLRLQFDQGYKFMLAVDALEDEAAATSFATALMPGAAVRDSINGVVTFDVPKANVVMSRLFEEMEGNKERLHIKDWGLSHTTLEEVFLKIVSDTNSMAGQAQKSGPVPTKETGVEMTNGKLARNEA